MPKAVIQIFDFIPKGSSSYNLKWPGPPRRFLRYTDVKHYVPKIKLREPAPAGFYISVFAKYKYKIPGSGSHLLYKLSYFWVRFDARRKNPSKITLLNHIPRGARDPDNSPEYTHGTFWLGAGKAGKVRGNVGTVHAILRFADVYLDQDRFLPDMPNLQLRGRKISPKHRIIAT